MMTRHRSKLGVLLIALALAGCEEMIEIDHEAPPGSPAPLGYCDARHVPEFPVHSWMPDETIRVALRKVDPAAYLTNEEWVLLLAIAEAAFLRSYIRLELRTAAAGEEAVTVRFVDGFSPRGHLGTAGDEIKLYMGNWSPGGNNHDGVSGCRWISTMGNVTAHELVHILAPRCPHTPYGDGPPTLFGSAGGHGYFGDHVRACLVDAGW